MQHCHLDNTGYHSGSSNSIVSTSSTSAAIINTTSGSSSTTTTSSCTTVVPMEEYKFLVYPNRSESSWSTMGDHQFLITSNVVDNTVDLRTTQNVQPPTEVD